MMTRCDVCGRVFPQKESLNHMIRYHADIYHKILSNYKTEDGKPEDV